MFLNILSGNFKKTPLIISKNKEYKITSLIVKKIIFNWIKLNKKSKCLDLFAGSGCLGFEIFSKYNCNLVLVEKNFFNYKFLLKTKFKIKSNKIKIYNISVLNFLKKNKKINKYDLVFFDPPFLDIKKIFLYVKYIIDILNINGKFFFKTLIDINIFKSYFKYNLKLINFKKVKRINLFLFKIIKI